jgi:hypothetical protein
MHCRVARLGAALLCSIGLATARAAADPSGGDRAGYPAVVIDRPLTLPPRTAQSAVGMDLSSGNSGGVSSTGETLAFGTDVGLLRRVQAGAYFALPVSPVSNFGTFLSNVQAQLGRAAKLRFDLGVTRFVAAADHSSRDFVTIALGVPLKLRVHRLLALVSGSTTALGFGPTLHLPRSAPIGFSGYHGNAVTNSALVTVVGDASGQLLTAQVPIGLLLQLHRAVAVTAGVAYRAVISLPNATVLHTLPIDGEVSVNVIPRLDVGFHFELAGFLGASWARGGPSTWHPGWFADTRVFSFIAGGRI